MHEWYKNVQEIILEIDKCIKRQDSESLTLRYLADKMGYSEFYISRKFREISGMQLRDYLRYRNLTFALKDVRDTDAKLLDIALNHGFSSHEAFTHAFKEAYGITPSEYRAHPAPVVLRTIIKPFDCYLMNGRDQHETEFHVLESSDDMPPNEMRGQYLKKGGTAMADLNESVKTYFITVPAHKFLHIRNYESIGYWDFWQKQSQIPGQDCETICGLLDSIRGKLDDMGGDEADSGSGQLMAYINAPEGRICSWGIPLAEAYGVRLPMDYDGEIPKQMQMMEVQEGDYIVFEHGPFDMETESSVVEEKIEKAMKEFDFPQSGYELDTTPERVFYFYHDCKRFWKYVRPVKKVG